MTAYVLFGAMPLVYIAQQLLTHARAILGGEMYAEMSTNYFEITQTAGVRLQLLAVDAGYIPLPQRIIGVVGAQLGLSPAAIPYYYTWSALLISALLVGSICLPAFRPLIANDYLRFVLGLVILLTLDFETRLYLNFTYLVVVPAAFLGALAFVTRNVPRWAWILPVLMISKPGVLTVLPAIIVGAIPARRRFRVIAAACVVAATIQLIRLSISSTQPGSLLQQGPKTSPVEKTLVALEYTVGFVGRLVLAPNAGMSAGRAIVVGTVVTILFLVVAVFSRSRASVLIVTGLGVAAGNMLLSAVVYSNWFSSDLSMLSIPILDRRVVVTTVAMLIAAAGVLAAIAQSPLLRLLLVRIARRSDGRILSAVRPVIAIATVVLFIGWLASSGWVRYSALVNSTVVPPSSDVSEWQTMAPAIASTQPVVCVPTAPFGWFYGRNCAMISGAIPAGLNYQDVRERADGGSSVVLPVPDLVRTHAVAAVAILVAPVDVEKPIHATLTLTTSDGEKHELRAESDVPLSGGALLFEKNPVDLVNGTRSAQVSFDTPVRIGWAAVGADQEISALWMGQ